MTFASPQGLANLALEPRAFNDRGLIEPWIYSGSAQPSPAIDAPASCTSSIFLRRMVGPMFMRLRAKCAHQRRHYGTGYPGRSAVGKPWATRQDPSGSGPIWILTPPRSVG